MPWRGRGRRRLGRCRLARRDRGRCGVARWAGGRLARRCGPGRDNRAGFGGRVGPYPVPQEFVALVHLLQGCQAKRFRARGRRT